MITTTIKNIPLTFQTASTVFSPGSVDAGTLAMLSICDFAPDDFVLDLGCGYGVVGILAAKLIGTEHVILCDVSEDAVLLARGNAQANQVAELTIRQSNGFAEVPEEGFTLILSNPPYHTDFSVAKHFIEVGFRKLAVGGRMFMVTKRLDWYRNKLKTVFGGVKVYEIGGYFVFEAEKRSKYGKKPERARKEKGTELSKKLRRKYGK